MFYIASCSHKYIQLKQQFDKIIYLCMVEWSLVSSFYSSLFIKEIITKMICNPLNCSHNLLTGYQSKIWNIGLFVYCLFPPASKKL